MRTSNYLYERCRRLAGMSLDELRVRTAQEFTKRWDLALCRLGLPLLKEDSWPLPHFSDSFFFKRDEVPRIADVLGKRVPEVVEQIIDQAEQICRHRFDLLGYKGIDYGQEIDWHSDAVHGKCAPRLPWFQIRYLDFAQVGDAKIIWELSRHQHLVTLAKAYRLTGEERYSKELFQQWYDWKGQNPYCVGINWASSLEVAFRSLSWLWVWYLLDGCSKLPSRFSKDLRHSLILNARHIERFLSTYFSPNTHLLGEGVGLFFIGTLLHGCQSAARWKALGWTTVLKEAQRQVLPDGAHFEQSTYYHTYAVDFFIHARILAGLNGITVPVHLDRTIEKMLDVLHSFGSAGPVPRFGDDDGGRVFDPRRNRSEHLLDPLATGAVLFNRSDFKSLVGDIREETIWLLGSHSVRRFDEVDSNKSTFKSFALRSAGVYAMCHSGPARHQFVIDAGPQGTGLAGHGHGDALSVQLTLDGYPMLIDPGTFVYADTFERDLFRGTASHNTVQIDGMSQAEPREPFKWRYLPKVTVERWLTNPVFDFFIGSHDGYARLKDPVRHQRYIFYLKSHFWLVHDVLRGAAFHKLDLSWHLAPGSLSSISGGAIFVSAEQREALALLSTGSSHYAARLLQGWHSPTYGNRERCPIFRISSQTQLPASFATLLIPLEEPTGFNGTLQPFEGEQTGVSVRAYTYSTAAGSTQHMVFADAAGSWQLGGLVSDARFLYYSIGNANRLQQFALCDGSHLEIDGELLFKATDVVPQFNWVSQENTSHLSHSSELSAALV